MRALVWTGPCRMEMQQIPMPKPAPGEALLRVEAVGICGSELSGYLGKNSLRRPPLVMGHEFSATVVSAEGTALSPGTTVIVNPLSGCGHCTTCRGGLEHLCPSRALLGAHRPGAFAEYVTAPVRSCLPLPPSVDDITGTLVEPVACGLHAVELGRVAAGSTVLVLGAGPIGLSVLVTARASGALTAIVTDVKAERRAIALAWGASAVVDPSCQDPVATVQELTDGLGVDVAIDAVGTDETRRQGLRALRPGGRLVLVGLHVDESTLAGNYAIRQELTVLGSFAYTPETFRRAAALVAAGIMRPDSSWLQERDLSEGPESFAQLVDGTAPVAKIVLRVGTKS